MRKCFKIVTVVFLLLLIEKSYSQTMYINEKYTEMEALNFSYRYANEISKGEMLKQIKEKQENIAANYTKLLVSKQMAYNSLYQVNEALRQGLQVKRIFTLAKEVQEELTELMKELKDYPEGSLILKNFALEIATISTSIVTDTQRVITSNPENLMSHAERDDIIQGLTHKMKLLIASLSGTRQALKVTKELGIWKKLIPFQDYINYDRMIMQDIIRKSQMFKE